MSDPHLQSLLYPFRDWSSSREASKVLCVGLTEALPPQPGSHPTFVQGFRPHYLRLAAARCNVLPEFPDEKFDAALIRLGRHRGQNEDWIASALRRLKPGGLLAAAGAKTDGAASLRRRIAKLVPDIAHAAMNHGEVFWLAARSNASEIADRIEPPALPLIEGRFHTAAGMFSSNRIDPGSRLLAEHLPSDLSGRIADFAAGWGYLSAELSERFAAILQLDLYEADYASLAAARKNVPARQGLETGFFWHDLLQEPIAARYDAIVCNPPFHLGREAEPSLGAGIIARAAEALQPRGRLLLVANRQLPYEAVLTRHFSSHRAILSADGFKLLEARK